MRYFKYLLCIFLFHKYATVEYIILFIIKVHNNIFNVLTVVNFKFTVQTLLLPDTNYLVLYDTLSIRLVYTNINLNLIIPND